MGGIELQWGRAGGHGSGSQIAEVVNRSYASMGPCRGARIGPTRESDSPEESHASMGPCRGARIGHFIAMKREVI